MQTIYACPVTSVRQHALSLGISPWTIYDRMFAKYPGKLWQDYTIDEIKAVSKKPRRPMRRRR